MAEFLTTNGASYHIERIIMDAQTTLVLISPFLRLSENFFTRLRDADRRGVKIVLVYGKDELSEQEWEKLAQLENLALRYLENLHAKCYFNEQEMVITSMNLYDFSEKRNREMGVLVVDKKDKELFSEVIKEAKSIVNSSVKKELKPTLGDVLKKVGVALGTAVKEELNEKYSSSGVNGYCIRCGTKIRHNLEKPYCRECYEEWSKWENPDYMESYCHTCGKDELTTMEKPQCRSCYSKSRR